MRLTLLALAALAGGAAASAQTAPDRWRTTAREIYREAIETPTVKGRGQTRLLGERLKARFNAAGFSEVSVRPTGGDSHALVLRWPAAAGAKGKPMALLAHMDVVEALPADWTTDPFKLV